MKTPNEVVLEVATEMMYTSMQKIKAETICNWATRLCEAMRSAGKESRQVGNVAKMIKVLKSTLSRIDEDEDDPVLVRIRKETEEALATPARNCDLYSTEKEAYRAYLITLKNETKKNETKKPICIFESWLFAEAKGFFKKTIEKAYAGIDWSERKKGEGK